MKPKPDTEFPCTQCGACCKIISPIYAKCFGLKQDEHGICAHLTIDGLCEIYEKRPAPCDVYKMWLRLHDTWGGWTKFMRDTALMCNQLQEELKMPGYYRLEIPDDPTLPPRRSSQWLPRQPPG